jgi:hypothetical protein
MADTDYRKEAASDALELIDEFTDEIIESLEAFMDDPMRVIDRDRAQTWLHESVIGKRYSLMDAATLLDQLPGHAESDSGLWQGQGPRDAISTQAAFTYRNAVYSIARSYLEDIVSEYQSFEPEDEDDDDDKQMEDARTMISEYIDKLKDR